MIKNKLVDVNQARRLKYLGFHEPTLHCYVCIDGYNWESLYYPLMKWEEIEANEWLKYHMINRERTESDPLTYPYADFNHDYMILSHPDMLSMPTYHEVGDWLRTKYGIVINVEQIVKDNYKYKVSYLFKEERNDWSSDVSDYFLAYKRAIESSFSIIESHGLHRIENFNIYN